MHLNNILTEYLQPVADNIEGSIEIASTKEMLCRIDEVNRVIKHRETRGEEEGAQELMDMVLVGIDTDQLFPSLDKQSMAKTIYEETLLSKLDFEEVDCKECLQYLAMNLYNEEIGNVILT